MLRRAVVSVLAITGVVTLVFGSAYQSLAQPQNPMVGTWAFNAARSSSAAPLPKKRDLTITQKAADITVAVHEVAADGATLNWQFTTRGDGKPVPVTGWAAVDTATSTLSGNTGKTVYMKDGKQVMESNTEVSADGKTLVIKGSRLDASGKVYAYSSHYDRK